MRRLSLTSWSVHRSLTSSAFTLLELPARARTAGIGTLEVCHFHFPTTDAAYLAAFRTALDDAQVELFSILIDSGDISAADQAAREADIQMIDGWMRVAAQLGAHAVRVVAGEAAPTDGDALTRSAAALARLADVGRELGVRVLTENFRPLTSTAANCLRLLDSLNGAIGLCADIGNFGPSARVEEFGRVIGRAESVHAKASYDGATIAPLELHRCLQSAVEANFDGPITLVYDRGPDDWRGIAELREIVAPYL